MAKDPIKSTLLSRIINLEHGFYPGNEVPPSPMGKVHQVHSSDIHEYKGSEQLDALSLPKADGVMTALNLFWVGVQTADCIPVLMASLSQQTCAAVHAGWKGVLGGILPKAVEAFEKKGIRGRDLYVAMGPSIGPCCFEVGKELIDEFEAKWGWAWAGSPKNRPHWKGRESFMQPQQFNDALTTTAPIRGSNHWMDLKAIATYQLINSGVPEPAIENIGICTYCGVLRAGLEELKAETNDFASHRRSTHAGNKAARQWSTIRFAKPELKNL